MSDLERAAQDACAAALREHGFVARRRGLLLRPGPGKKVTGWLGMNLATWDLPDKIQINPVIGVRHVPLEKPLVTLAGWDAPVAVVSQPLGYLMPQHMFEQWDFPAGGDLAAVAADLAAAVAEYGLPFIAKWSDWPTFAAEIAGSGLLPDAAKQFVLPLVAAQDGDPAEADRLIRAELDRIGGADDMYAQSYREFAAGFTRLSRS